MKETNNRDLLLEEFLREARRLRTVFRLAGLDPKEFRRRLRGGVQMPPGIRETNETLHRSAASKQVFFEAMQFAAVAEQPVLYPVHLLLALLKAGDGASDAILRKLKVSKNRLVEIANGEVLIGEAGDAAGNRRMRVGRN